MTVIAQQSAMKALEVVPLDFRILNAMVAYTEYLYRCFVPVDLAVLYPYPGSIAPWKVLVSAAVLIAVTALVILRRKTPALRVGWFWYLGTLVPVIGLVQVGVQATADRYTYIPFIGLFILLTWLVARPVGQGAASQGRAGIGGCAHFSRASRRARFLRRDTG